MDPILQPSDPVTFVISEVIESDRIQEYEAWTRGINRAAQQCDGFLGVETIRPRDNTHCEYVIIVKFDNYANFRTWVTSPLYREWIDKSRGLISERSHQELPSGLELWFTLPRSRRQRPFRPAYYKKVIIGVLAVYPLTMASNVLLGPFLQHLPPFLGLLVSVIAVSALLTYPVMPWLTRVLDFWLYPSSSKKR